MPKRFYVFVFLFAVSFMSCSFAFGADKKDIKISNGYFSFKLPYETKGTYSVIKNDKGIFIYHTESKKEGFGGFAFGLKLYKNPKDHAMMPGGVKVGELNGKRGTIYDMVLIRPTDVQFNYEKGINNDYMKLYNFAEKVEIKGVHGNEYGKSQGMKGRDLYGEILQKNIKAINEKWDSDKLEQENISYMYNVLSISNRNLLDKIGYAYYDTNSDGIDELLIGEISDGNWKGIIYDIYTMVDRKPAHVISGGSRNRYYVCNNDFICNEYSSGANESGMNVYVLLENSTELYPQVSFKYDGYENKNKPWFLKYDFSNNKWENVSENVYTERRVIFNKYKRFDYTPLSKFK